MATAMQVQATKAQAATNAPCEAPVVKVIGQGTLLETGWPFVLVTSASELGKTYTCAYRYEGVFVGSRMVCSCMAGQFGRACKHQMIAREWLHATTPTADRARVPSSVPTHVKRRPARQKRPDAAGCDHQRDTSMLRRDNRSFAERFGR